MFDVFFSLRSIHILPNQFLGLVGQHLGGFPVEHMCQSHDENYLITSSQDSCHFWPLSQIPTLPTQADGREEEEDTVEEEAEEEEVVVRKKKRKENKNMSLLRNSQSIKEVLTFSQTFDLHNAMLYHGFQHQLLLC